MSSQAKQTLVTRTYQMGVRFEGTREERRKDEKEANQRIKGLQVQQEDIIRDKKAINAAMVLARTDPNLNAKMGASSISKITRNSRNITQSAYYWLFVAAKGTVDREKKVEDFFNQLLQRPEQAVEWIIFGRSPRMEKYLYKKWEVSRLYVINLINRTRRQIDKYCPNSLKFNTKLPLLTQKEIERAIIRYYKKLCEELTSTQQGRSLKDFLENTRLLTANVTAVAPMLTSWNNVEHPSRWKSMKELNRRIAEVVGKPSRMFFSALRTIVVFALFPQIGETVKKILEKTHPEKVVNPPYRRKKKGRAPIILLMNERFVVMRPGNSEHMTFLARADGEFEIGFLLKNHPRITAKLVFSKKVRGYLLNGARIRVLYIRYSSAPSYKVRVSVVLEGPQEIFIGTKLTREFAKKIKVPKSEYMGVDVNRIGKQMVALSNDVKLPKELLTLTERYYKLSKTKIPELSYSLTNKGKKKDSYSYVKTKGELSRVTQRKFRILKEIKSILPHFLAAVMVKAKCKVLFQEDLEIDPRGKKGALAKAIRTMPKGAYIFEKAVLIASSILGYEIKLMRVDSRGTSRYHNGCRGTLERSLKRYDRARCRKCGNIVDTHVNSAKNVRDKGIELLQLQDHSSPHVRSMGESSSSESKPLVET